MNRRSFPLTTTTLNSPEEIRAFFERQRHNADVMDDSVREWQAAIKAGDFYFQRFESMGQLLDIFGEVIVSQFAEDRDLMARTPNRRLVRAFSEACPEGEVGTVHVASIWKVLTPEEFAQAKATGWTLPVHIAAIFAGDRPHQL